MRYLLGCIIIACIGVGVRYYAVQAAAEQMTSKLTQSTTKLAADLQQQTEASLARLSKQQVETAARNEKQRMINSVVGCARNASKDKCHCYDQRGQQVPGIADDICLKVVEGGLNWLKTIDTAAHQ